MTENIAEKRYTFENLNVVTTSYCVQCFRELNVDVMISPGCNAFRVISDKQIGVTFKYFQIQTHVQTARESHDLNMDQWLQTNLCKNILLYA